MNAVYYEKWIQGEHIILIVKRPKNDQDDLADANTVIYDEDKLQFYIEQIYDNATFEN